MKLCMVDDEAGILQLAKMVFATKLADRTVSTLRTNDRQEALAWLQAEAPDQVVLDGQLTNNSWDGPWIARQLLAAGFAGKIVIYSGSDAAEIRAQLGDDVSRCEIVPKTGKSESLMELAERLRT